jgi:serine/threonine protein phosphatase 1
MRYLAIGDIHGCADALERLLALVQPGPDDQLITLGDYVGRGPDTKRVLDILIRLNETGRLVALRGNHEEMMLEARKGNDFRFWLSCGGKEALQSYRLPLERESLKKIPAAHWDFLDVCVDWHEIDTHFFVHAQANPHLPLDEQPLRLLHWESLHDVEPHYSGKVMVCGHTEQRNGRPRNWGHAVCIDTRAYAGGWLTCLDVKSGRYWQANNKGEVREGSLDEPEESSQT